MSDGLLLAIVGGSIGSVLTMLLRARGCPPTGLAGTCTRRTKRGRHSPDRAGGWSGSPRSPCSGAPRGGESEPLAVARGEEPDVADEQIALTREAFVELGQSLLQLGVEDPEEAHKLLASIRRADACA